MAPNFLALATTLENLGARWLLAKKVNFVPCGSLNGSAEHPFIMSTVKHPTMQLRLATAEFVHCILVLSLVDQLGFLGSLLVVLLFYVHL